MLVDHSPTCLQSCGQSDTKRAMEIWVKRLKCGGCGAVLADTAAFQEHCGEVEHGDDFMYDCEEVTTPLHRHSCYIPEAGRGRESGAVGVQ